MVPDDVLVNGDGKSMEDGLEEEPQHRQSADSPGQNHVVNCSSMETGPSDPATLSLSNSNNNNISSSGSLSQPNSSSISHFLSQIANIRRDEMTLNINSLLSGATTQQAQSAGTGTQQQPATPLPSHNSILDDLSRNLMNFGQTDDESGALMRHHPLFGRGACKWPGCELTFDDLQTFTK